MTDEVVPAAPLVAPLTDKQLASVRACPRCEAPASPQRGVQRCVHCKKPFVLLAGPALDPTVVPPAHSGEKPIKVNYADAVLRHAATVDAEGIWDAELDPVTGRIPVGKRLIPYTHVASIGLYRRIDWVTLIVLVLLFFGPVVLPLLVVSFSTPWVFALSLPALALFVLGLKKAIGVGVQRMRVAAPGDVITLRFDSPMWKRKKFLAAALRRTGIGEVDWK